MHRVAALVLLSCFCLQTGCLSKRVIEDTRKPEIEINAFGDIRFNGERVKLGKIASAMHAAGLHRDQEINIRVPDRVDETLRNAVCAELVRGGYTRTIFVKARKASSTVKAGK
jgi:hypothetical protein